MATASRNCAWRAPSSSALFFAAFISAIGSVPISATPPASFSALVSLTGTVAEFEKNARLGAAALGEIGLNLLRIGDRRERFQRGARRLVELRLFDIKSRPTLVSE